MHPAGVLGRCTARTALSAEVCLGCQNVWGVGWQAHTCGQVRRRPATHSAPVKSKGLSSLLMTRNCVCSATPCSVMVYTTCSRERSRAQALAPCTGMHARMHAVRGAQRPWGDASSTCMVLRGGGSGCRRGMAWRHAQSSRPSPSPSQEQHAHMHTCAHLELVGEHLEGVVALAQRQLDAGVLLVGVGVGGGGGQLPVQVARKAVLLHRAGAKLQQAEGAGAALAQGGGGQQGSRAPPARRFKGACMLACVLFQEGDVCAKLQLVVESIMLMPRSAWATPPAHLWMVVDGGGWWKGGMQYSTASHGCTTRMHMRPNVALLLLHAAAALAGAGDQLLACMRLRTPGPTRAPAGSTAGCRR